MTRDEALQLLERKCNTVGCWHRSSGGRISCSCCREGLCSIIPPESRQPYMDAYDIMHGTAEGAVIIPEEEPVGKPGIVYELGPECPACGDIPLDPEKPHDQAYCLKRLTAIYNRHFNMTKAWAVRLQKTRHYWQAQTEPSADPRPPLSSWQEFCKDRPGEEKP